MQLSSSCAPLKIECESRLGKETVWLRKYRNPEFDFWVKLQLFRVSRRSTALGEAPTGPFVLAMRVLQITKNICKLDDPIISDQIITIEDCQYILVRLLSKTALGEQQNWTSSQ
jgi:hypothetical protein